MAIFVLTMAAGRLIFKCNGWDTQDVSHTGPEARVQRARWLTKVAKKGGETLSKTFQLLLRRSAWDTECILS